MILGNWDAWSIEGFPVADDPVGMMLYEIGAWWAKRLSDDDRAFVRGFEPTLEIPIGNGSRMVCYHGSPLSFNDWIFSTTPDEELEKMFDGLEAAVLVGGHTHLQMLRRFGPSLVVNPGSVGQPFSQWWPQPIRVGHWAEYGVVETDGERTEVDLRRVPFDVDALLRLFAKAACRTPAGGSTPGTPNSGLGQQQLAVAELVPAGRRAAGAPARRPASTRRRAPRR